MKKSLFISMLLIIIMSVVGISIIINNDNYSTNNTIQPLSADKTSVSDKSKKDKELDKKNDNNEKETLLIYMVGSDLESRSGAGTDDLKEIEESGIDLEKANVLVYAGGAPKWHNDIVSEEENTILQLGGKGFEPVAKMGFSNMGESNTLLEFLDYSYDNYPSNSYSLIMWDHGNGPIIGYGKDMLFDNDSLTLLEMDNALKASPFGKGKKLEWVGFDACLMSSAELVCIWDNYAKYLVASQEIEPSFGWDYSFLKDFGHKESVALIKDIVDYYMNACNAYYEKRGYDNRDTTLACINLSYAGKLENAINDFFAKADKDVYTQYNTFVSKRVDTRALGRASTGSEYDLIDLNDMAKQLSEIYPDEAKEISDIIKKMVIKNGTNTQDCWGLSFYYPFYNKYFYEDSWGNAYGQIGLFDNYKSYLNKYQEIWLKDDKLDKYASSNVPKKTTDGENRAGFDFDELNNVARYELQLTPEQNENFAEAKVYILENGGEDVYHVVFSDNNVSNNNGVLSYDFEGKGIYVKNKFSEYFLPVSVSYDSVGDIKRYSLSRIYGCVGFDVFQHALFDVALNKKTEEITLSSIKPYSEPASTRNMVGGKTEEYNMNDWAHIEVVRADHKYLQRYENGVVKPIADWINRDGIVYFERFTVGDGIDFEYATLDVGEYSLIFEITDTQNNKYCSEPVKIDVESDGKGVYKPEEINIDWNDGDRVKIFEMEGSSLYLKKIYTKEGFSTKAGISYALEAENENDYGISYEIDNIIINGEFTVDNYMYISVEPNQCETASFGKEISKNLIDAGVIDSIHSISGNLEAQIINEYTNDLSLLDSLKTIEKNQTININISGDALETNLKARFPKAEFSSPFYGASSGEQEIFNNGKIKITLLAFGKAEKLSGCGFVCIENLTDEEQGIDVVSYCINGYMLDANIAQVNMGGAEKLLSPKSKRIGVIDITPDDMWENNISEIETFELGISLFEPKHGTYVSESDELVWVDVNLNVENSSEKKVQQDLKEIIFDKNNVKIYVTEYGISGGDPQWKITVENESDEDICVQFGDENSDSANLYALDLQLKAHSKKNAELGVLNDSGDFSAKVYVLDYFETKILYTGDEMFSLKTIPMEVPTEEINVDWNSGDEQTIDVRNGVTLVIKKDYFSDNPCYALEIRNETNKSVHYELEDVIINGNIVTNDIEKLYANSFYNDKKVNIPAFTAAADFGAIDEIHSISFKVKDKSHYLLPTALNGHKFNINISDDARIKDFKEMYKPLDLSNAFFEAKAIKQEILNNDKLKIDFLGFGGVHHPKIYTKTVIQTEHTTGNCGFCIENVSENYQTVTIEGIAINGAYISVNKSIKVAPGSIAYMSKEIYEEWLLNCGIESIAEISVAVTIQEDGSSVDSKPMWLPIKLTECGTKTAISNSDSSVIYEAGGVEILFDSYEVDKYGDAYYSLTIVNSSDENVSISLLEEDGWSYYASGIKLGPKQYCKETIRVFGEIVDEIEFDVVVKDFYGTNVLAQSDNLIKINGTYENKGG